MPFVGSFSLRGRGRTRVAGDRPGRRAPTLVLLLTGTSTPNSGTRTLLAAKQGGFALRHVRGLDAIARCGAERRRNGCEDSREPRRHRDRSRTRRLVDTHSLSFDRSPDQNSHEDEIEPEHQHDRAYRKATTAAPTVLDSDVYRPKTALEAQHPHRREQHPPRANPNSCRHVRQKSDDQATQPRRPTTASATQFTTRTLNKPRNSDSPSSAKI